MVHLIDKISIYQNFGEPKDGDAIPSGSGTPGNMKVDPADRLGLYSYGGSSNPWSADVLEYFPHNDGYRVVYENRNDGSKRDITLERYLLEDWITDGTLEKVT